MAYGKCNRLAQLPSRGIGSHLFINYKHMKITNLNIAARLGLAFASVLMLLMVVASIGIWRL